MSESGTKKDLKRKRFDDELCLASKRHSSCVEAKHEVFIILEKKELNKSFSNNSNRSDVVLGSVLQQDFV